MRRPCQEIGLELVPFSEKVQLGGDPMPVASEYTRASGVESIPFIGHGLNATNEGWAKL